MKKGLLLINLGTPDSTAVADVKKYLKQFLMDPRVIDVNPVWRYILVNWIIVPSRSKASAALYEKIWTDRGSPLLFHSQDLKIKVQVPIAIGTKGTEHVVELGMRYQNPSIESAIKKLLAQNVSSIHVLPLYPHYASSSTESSLDEVKRVMKNLGNKTPLTFTTHFFNHAGFIDCFVENAKKFDLDSYDHFLFSYHGLPERHIRKSAVELGIKCCTLGSCCDVLTTENEKCYRASAFATTRMLVEKLGIPSSKYTSSFQSRLNDKWLKPFSDVVVKELARQGKKRVLAFSPAFVADCLETTYEVGSEYLEIFREHGGEELHLVPSLNSNESWVKVVRELGTVL